MREDLRRLVMRWSVKEKTFEREIEEKVLPFIGGKNAVFLYGPRRSGKSTEAKRLLGKCGKGAKTRYVNLEDPALEGLLGVGLLDGFSEGLGRNDVLVLDEVQLVPLWEKWVRRAVDLRQCGLIVSGSSAKLLSGEFATSLGGRGVGFQVLPLSFREFSCLRGKNLESYLDIGGYPEAVLSPEKKDKLMESYFELALMKDIVSRYRLKSAAELRTLALYLITNSGKLTSLKQIRSVLGLSYDTARRFIDYLESAFLIFQVPYFSYSMKDSLARQRKVYAWDAGMQSYASKSFSADLGRKAEAAVACELKRRGYELYYWRGKNEVDFVARKLLGLTPINVTYSERIAGREEAGLAEFCSMNKAKKAVILYLGPTKDVERTGFNLHLINLEEWLLERQTAASNTPESERGDNAGGKPKPHKRSWKKP